MTCAVVNYNPQLAKLIGNASSMAYATTSPSESDQLANGLFIPPSALHSQSSPPTNSIYPDPQKLLHLYSKWHLVQENSQGKVSTQAATAAALLTVMPASQVPPVDESLEVVCQDHGCVQSPARTGGAKASNKMHDWKLTDWLKRFGEQLVEPPWWETELAPRIHQTLKERENAIGDIQFRSPQLEQRQWLVDYLQSVCQHLLISHGTRFLAVFLMDHFMDKHVVMDYRMKLVALTCLLVAAKFEEADENLPTIEMMVQMAQVGPSQPDYYTREEFHKMELYLLRFFDWSVSYPSSAHFANYYLLHGTDLETEGSSCPREGRESDVDAMVNVKEDLEVYNTHLLEASLRDYTFLQFAPSQIAAAAVCASRMCVGIRTAWTSKLQSTTGYSLEQLYPIVDGMLKLLSD